MLLSGLRRLAVILVVLVGLTAGASLVVGALAHARLGRAVAEGFYAVGAAVLLASFVLGVRGPMRADWEDVGGRPPGPFRGVLPQRIRRSSPDERVESKRNSLALFAVGLVLIVIGGLVDPTRRMF